ncbi:MAG: alpha/beta hydrolase [Flavobacteriaceae bacterium]
MKKFVLLFLFFILLSCVSEDLTETYLEKAKIVLKQNSTTNPIEEFSLFFEDLSYGSEVRNKFDLFLPQDGNAKGIVVFFHGGSFLFNDKSDAYQEPYVGIIKNLLTQNVAVVNSNYSFLNSTNSQGVQTPLSEGNILLNHIKTIAPDLSLNADKIVLSGVSSGAGIALWNGLQAEHNEGVLGVVALETQSSYNLFTWENLFSGLDINEITQNSTEFQLLFSLFYGDSQPTQQQLDLVDFIEFIDSSDPDLYLLNNAGTQFLTSSGTIDLNVLYHSVLHSDALRGRAIQEGLNFSGAFAETPDDFILRLFN